jgi:agmatine deiminase
MPPEWAPHESTWTSWPFDDELWVGHLDGVRRDFAGLVATIARFEPVNLNVRDEETEADARTRIADAAQRLDLSTAEAVTANVTYHRLPLNDVWFRDNGPLFVQEGVRDKAVPRGTAAARRGAASDEPVRTPGRVALTDWGFNAWGEKYAPWTDDDRAPATLAARLNMKRFAVPAIMEGGSLEVNGHGVCLTTRSCLLEPNRNPDLGAAEIELLLRDHLGITQLVWLEDGLEGDHTDGHIDTIVRFTDDDTIVCSVEPREDDPNHATMARNLAQLRALRRADGTPYRVVELPLPLRRMELEGDRLPPTYANFYVGNGFVVVPQYADANDEAALAVLRPLFPDREVIGLSAESLITGGGAFHCVTQQQPRGEVYRA